LETLNHFLTLIRPHLSALALTATWIGVLFIYLRRRLQWHKKEFLGYVNFSLNYAVGPNLCMRTLVELPAAEVWLNQHGVRMVGNAAQKATLEQPYIAMKNPKDQQFLNRAVLNVLSSRFAETYIAAALGVPVRTSTFLYAITCEKYEEIRTLKIRVLIMAEQTLIELFGPANRSAELVINNIVYRSRLQTLRLLYDVHQKEQGSLTPILGKIELGVVDPKAACENRVSLGSADHVV